MRAFTFTASAVVGPAVAASGGTTRLRGVIVTENAGSPAAARINVRDGGVVGGNIILPIKLAASGTTIVDFEEGIAISGACYVEVATGTVVGTLLVD